MTVTEYKERKSQLIDTLTGTKSRTKATIGEGLSYFFGVLSVTGSSIKIRSEFIPPRPSNFAEVVQEQVILYFIE
jgi:hypothetical protein